MVMITQHDYSMNYKYRHVDHMMYTTAVIQRKLTALSTQTIKQMLPCQHIIDDVKLFHNVNTLQQHSSYNIHNSLSY